MACERKYGRKMGGFVPYHKGYRMDRPHGRSGRRHGHRWVSSSRDVRLGY